MHGDHRNIKNNKSYFKIGYKDFQKKRERVFEDAKYMSSGAAVKKEKATISVLGKLRKQTGYSLSLCKKALNNCDQDVEKAKSWLEVCYFVIAFVF